MRCIVTAGPTWEPLDQVRRLTNFSTGSLGGGLANALAEAGHDVVLLLSETATWCSPLFAVRVESFSTTGSLSSRLEALAFDEPGALFHAAAVSDYSPAVVSTRGPDGNLTAMRAGKVETRSGSLFVELAPTPKILPRLRDWFPKSRITGWKYEVDGTNSQAIDRGRQQISSARSDACVVNGPACGSGLVWLRRDHESVAFPSRATLLQALVADVPRR